jgi:hypothetical protein
LAYAVNAAGNINPASFVLAISTFARDRQSIGHGGHG